MIGLKANGYPGYTNTRKNSLEIEQYDRYHDLLVFRIFNHNRKLLGSVKLKKEVVVKLIQGMIRFHGLNLEDITK